MLPCRLLLTIPLLAGYIRADGSTESTAIPNIGHGFVNKLLDRVHTDYIHSRDFNNESLAMFNDIWKKNAEKVIEGIKSISGELKKVAKAYDGFRNPPGGLNPAAQLMQGGTLLTSGMALITNVNNVLADIATKFGGLVPLALAVSNNEFNFLWNVGSYVPAEVYTKVKTLTEEIKEQILMLEARVKAAKDQLDIALLRIYVSKAALELPVRRFASRVKELVLRPINRILAMLRILEAHVRFMLFTMNNAFKFGVGKIRAFTDPIRNFFRSIRSRIRGRVSRFMGLFQRKKPQEPALTSDTTPAPSATIPASATTSLTSH